MNNIFTLSYWFNLRPVFFVNWASHLLLLFFILLFAGGIFAKMYVVKYKVDKLLKKGIRRVGDSLIVMSLVGFILYFFSYEEIYVFSMRIWYVVWLILFAWWLWTIYQYITVEIPRKRAMQAEREAKQKWFKK